MFKRQNFSISLFSFIVLSSLYLVIHGTVELGKQHHKETGAAPAVKVEEGVAAEVGKHGGSGQKREAVINNEKKDADEMSETAPELRKASARASEREHSRAVAAADEQSIKKKEETELDNYKEEGHKGMKNKGSEGEGDEEEAKEEGFNADDDDDMAELGLGGDEGHEGGGGVGVDEESGKGKNLSMQKAEKPVPVGPMIEKVAEEDVAALEKHFNKHNNPAGAIKAALELLDKPLELMANGPSTVLETVKGALNKVNPFATKNPCQQWSRLHVATRQWVQFIGAVKASKGQAALSQLAIRPMVKEVSPPMTTEKHNEKKAEKRVDEKKPQHQQEPAVENGNGVNDIVALLEQFVKFQKDGKVTAAPVWENAESCEKFGEMGFIYSVGTVEKHVAVDQKLKGEAKAKHTDLKSHLLKMLKDEVKVIIGQQAKFDQAEFNTKEEKSWTTYLFGFLPAWLSSEAPPPPPPSSDAPIATKHETSEGLQHQQSEHQQHGQSSVHGGQKADVNNVHQQVHEQSQKKVASASNEKKPLHHPTKEA